MAALRSVVLQVSQRFLSLKRSGSELITGTLPVVNGTPVLTFVKG